MMATVERDPGDWDPGEETCCCCTPRRGIVLAVVSMMELTSSESASAYGRPTLVFLRPPSCSLSLCRTRCRD